MSSSVPAAAIPWTTSAVDSTAPVTTDTLIRGWLNENGFDDLTDLSLTDLQALIAFLSQHTGVAGVSALLNQLKQLEAGWRSSGNGEDELSNQIDNLKFQIKFLDILAKNTTGVDALDEAKQSSTGNLQKLEDAKKAILEGSLPWEEDTSLLNLDSVRLTNLRQEALDAGNQELADKIKTRIDEIGQLIQEIVKGEVKLLENEQNLMASIPTR